MNTNMTGIRWFLKDNCVLVLWAKIALGGLRLFLSVFVVDFYRSGINRDEPVASKIS